VGALVVCDLRSGRCGRWVLWLWKVGFEGGVEVLGLRSGVGTVRLRARSGRLGGGGCVMVGRGWGAGSLGGSEREEVLWRSGSIGGRGAVWSCAWGGVRSVGWGEVLGLGRVALMWCYSEGGRAGRAMAGGPGEMRRVGSSRGGGGVRAVSIGGRGRALAGWGRVWRWRGARRGEGRPCGRWGRRAGLECRWVWRSGRYVVATY